jgi:hypothetical protein
MPFVVKNRFFAGLIGLVAIALLVLAVPRTISSFLLIPSGPVMIKLQLLQPVTASELDMLVASQRSGLDWDSRGRTRTDLGLAYLLKADQRPHDDVQWRQDMGKAITSLREGLALAPANPYAWTRLAYAETQLNGWSPEAIAALRLAFVTAPYEPRLALSRLRLSFLAWPHMTPEDRRLVFQQIRFAWKNSPRELTALAFDLRVANLVRAALLTSPDDIADFEKRLKAREG